MYAQTNLPYPNRIQLALLPFIGPFTQVGPLGSFDPRRDLQVYVDGTLQAVQTFSFDMANNRYLLFTASTISLQGVIQIVHHVPSPPFFGLPASPPFAVELPGFALTAVYSTQGDESLIPTASFGALPNPVASGSPVTLYWSTTNVYFVRIHDSAYAFDTGILPNPNSNGSFAVTTGFSATTALAMTCYDLLQNPIGGLLPTVTVTVVAGAEISVNGGGLGGPELEINGVGLGVLYSINGAAVPLPGSPP